MITIKRIILYFLTPLLDKNHHFQGWIIYLTNLTSFYYGSFSSYHEGTHFSSSSFLRLCLFGFWTTSVTRFWPIIKGWDRRIFTRIRLREHCSFALFRELIDCPFQRTRKLSRHLEGCSLAGKERARQKAIRERAGQRCFLVTASLQWTRFAGVANPTTMSADRFS